MLRPAQQWFCALFPWTAAEPLLCAAGPVWYPVSAGDALGLMLPVGNGKIKKLPVLCDHSGLGALPPERWLLCQHPTLPAHWHPWCRLWSMEGSLILFQ